MTKQRRRRHAVLQVLEMIGGHPCEKCGSHTTNPEDDYAEHVCDDCRQDEAERAWERMCEDFHDGGSTQFKTLQQQQIEARKLK